MNIFVRLKNTNGWDERILNLGHAVDILVKRKPLTVEVVFTSPESQLAEVPAALVDSYKVRLTGEPAETLLRVLDGLPTFPLNGHHRN